MMFKCRPKGFWPWTFPAYSRPASKTLHRCLSEPNGCSRDLHRIWFFWMARIFFTKNSWGKSSHSWLRLVSTTHRPGCHKHHPIGARFLPISECHHGESVNGKKHLVEWFKNDSEPMLQNASLSSCPSTGAIFTDFHSTHGPAMFFLAPRVPLRQWNQIWSHRAVCFLFGTVWLR